MSHVKPITISAGKMVCLQKRLGKASNRHQPPCTPRHVAVCNGTCVLLLHFSLCFGNDAAASPVRRIVGRCSPATPTAGAIFTGKCGARRRRRLQAACTRARAHACLIATRLAEPATCACKRGRSVVGAATHCPAAAKSANDIAGTRRPVTVLHSEASSDSRVVGVSPPPP